MKTTTIVLALAAALVANGCATKSYVKQETGAIHTRVDQIQGQVEDNQTELKKHGQRLDEQGQQINAQGEQIQGASKTAQEALQRALDAGKLAQGKLLYETVLTDDKVHFGFDKSILSKEAEAALDDFANNLKEQNKGVYIEIQGHTDSVGSEDYNNKLGLDRAEAVRRYLNQKDGLPLHRMSVISYGESAPVADNKTREGRSQNRRVVLVVLE
jgi:peptidoglycan-associated lipoprotein